MKSILKRVAGVAIAAVLALGMLGCSSGSNDDPVLPPASNKENVATTAFSVASGDVASGTSVTITCATEGAKIYYTTDGSAPTASSTEYTAAISITESVTIKAIAVKDGMNDSAVASASYTIKAASNKETVATPAFSIASGEVVSGTTVTITCTTEGAKIYYTTDSSAPTTASTAYTAAISVTEAVTIKAIAVKDGMNDSAVASASYTIKVPAAAADFVLLPAGDFQMGSNQGYDDNKPVHTVTISKAFYMCDHEVTQAEYEAVMGEGSNPSYFKTRAAAEGEVQENRPVEQVSWYMAIVYCNKRSIKEGLTPCYTISGKTDPAEWGTIPTSSDATWNAVECNWTVNGYRLPTEAEWEYAARAGDTTVDSLTWSGTNAETSLVEYAWYSSYAGYKTHEVKKKSENANKLYDMSGNVFEWCWDWWPASDNYSADAATDPRGDASGSRRVYRGGSYSNGSDECAVSYHYYDDPIKQSSFLGFRVVRNAN
ncbi:SUMF1/EgtB/PvdO family nonheme iron enzyme [Treponema sp.]|uniref:SUMF1/EgtB/PvdO family nonheme iron enzyme n=1 Tax=Treponema sp. TaxID=166 RepID=UPI00388E6A50